LLISIKGRIYPALFYFMEIFMDIKEYLK